MNIVYLDFRARPAASVERHLSSYQCAVERAHAEQAMVLGQLALRAVRRVRALLGKTTRLSVVS